MRQLQKIMKRLNLYAAAFKHMYEVEQEQIKQFDTQINTLKMIFKCGNDQ